MTQNLAPHSPQGSTPALPPAAQRLRQGRLLLARAASENGGPDLDRYPAASAAAMDTYFRERLEELSESQPGLLAAPFALVAVGGYGRGELQPASDVDVLLLYAQDIPGAAGELSRGLFHPLWDLGLDLGHGVRSGADCLRLAREDTQVLTSLLDTRLVAGDEALVGRFLRDFSAKALAGAARSFGQWVLEHNAGRRAEYGDSSGLLEPDLKNGLGALRDVHQIHWLARVLAAQPEGPAKPRLPFSPEDLSALEADRRFLMAARTALHLAAGRKTDRLVFDRQPEVARLLGFTGAEPPGHDGGDASEEGGAEYAAAMARGLAVEAFLSRLHQAMTRIRAMRQAAWIEAFPPAPPVAQASPVPRSGQGPVISTPTGLTLAEPEALATPADLLALYLAAARAARPVAWSGLRATRRALAERPASDFADLPGLLPALLEIFRASGRETDMAPLGVRPPQAPAGGLTRALKSFFAPAKVPGAEDKPAPDARECVPSVAGALQSMLDTGLLSALVPEFGPVEHLVQFDDFHIHPVGKHTLEVVRGLAAMLHDAEGWQGGMARGLDAAGLFDRLLLAGFCHDLAKPGRDHSGAGAELCARVLGRLGADGPTVADVAFLVRQHLNIPKTATRRDLADESVAAGLAEICETAPRLDMLLLLAVADSQATGPRAWSPWTASLFTELARKARRLLTAGPLAEPHAVEHGRQVREELLKLSALPGSPVGPEQARALLERLPPRAALVLPASTLLRHMDLIRRFEAAMEEDLMRKPSGKGGIGVTEIDAVALAHKRFQVSIAAPDQPGLFAVMAGVLALHDLNILSAEVLTWKGPAGWRGGPIAVDVFVVEEPGEGLYLDDLWQRIRRAIAYALTGKLALEYRLEQKRESPLAKRSAAPKGRRKVRVDNEASDFYTLVEVAAPDRLGLLYDLASALTGLGLTLHLARIATSAGRIHDTFYVRGEDGLKVAGPDRAEEIRKALLAAAK